MLLLFQQGGEGEERKQDPGTVQRHGPGQTQEDVDHHPIAFCYHYFHKLYSKRILVLCISDYD